MSLNTPTMITYVPPALTSSRLHKISPDITKYQHYYKSYRETFSILSIINPEKIITTNSPIFYTSIEYNTTNTYDYTQTQDLYCDIFWTTKGVQMPPNITIQTYNNSITTSPVVIHFHFHCVGHQSRKCLT